MLTQYIAGIDGGSSYTKTIIVTDDRQALGKGIASTGADITRAVDKSLGAALREAGIIRDELNYVSATGYGRGSIKFANKAITDIYSQAKGTSSQIPTARTLVDVGGQDIKGIKIENGKVTQFMYNDKCAAGTGRFMEVLARVMEVDINDLGPLSLTAEKGVQITSSCTVFAESEIVALIGQAIPKPLIAKGLHQSFARRVHALIGRLGLEPDVVLTGGAAKNLGFLTALETELGLKLVVPKEPQFTAAYGAALIGIEALRSKERPGRTQQSHPV